MRVQPLTVLLVFATVAFNWLAVTRVNASPLLVSCDSVEQLRGMAETGDAKAQYALGVKYVEGRCVPKDLVAAHMWFTAAATTGDEQAAQARDAITPQMTANQVQEAWQRAREWLIQHRLVPQRYGNGVPAQR